MATLTLPRTPAALGAALLAAALSALSCSDGTGPGGGPAGPALLLSGAGTTDTVDVLPARPLVVELRGERGAPLARETVELVAPDPLRVRFAQQPRPDTAVLSTDAEGRASVALRFGSRAGAASVRIRVPRLGIDTVAAFTVRPGVPVRVRVAPADTSLYVGRSFTLGAALVDRHGNPHDLPVTTTLESGPVELGPDRSVTGRAVGRARIRARAAGMEDSAGVSVVPEGMLALWSYGTRVGDPSGISVAALDGSGARLVVSRWPTPREYGPGPLVEPRWDPSGARVVYADPVAGVPRLFVSDLEGSVRRLLPDGGAALSEAHPAFAPDGAWIYFAGLVDSFNRALFRVRGDGTGLERLPAAPGREPGPDAALTVSPDGTRVAYVGTMEVGNRVVVRVVATGAATLVGAAPAGSPRWSPRGDLIAYVNGPSGAGHSGPLRLVRPDGTGDRAATAGTFFHGLDWSPDGRYLAIQPAVGIRGLEVVVAETGERLPLGFGRSWFGPSWRR